MTTNPDTNNTTDRRTAARPAPKPTPPVHLYVLLDRSGSMESIRTEVVAGFNAFLAGQQVNGDDARLTLVQFDDQDVAETIVADAPIRRVRPLKRNDFIPRGSTPLLDATGLLVARAKAHTETTRIRGLEEKVVIVSITDGEENASREFTRASVKALVKEREEAGWTFVFLSAGLDAYTDAESIGYSAGSVQQWAPDAAGAGLAFGSLDVAVKRLRGEVRAAAPMSSQEAFAGAKPAEADRRAKRGDTR